MSARKGQDYQALAKWENPERPTGVGSSRYDPLDQPPSSAMSANFVSHHSNEPLRMRGQAASGSRRGNDDALHPHQASVPGDDVDVGPYGHLDHGSGDGMRHTTKPATSTAFSEGAAQSHLGVSKQLGGDASWASSKEKRSDSTNRTAVSQGPVRLAFRPLSKAELEADDRLVSIQRPRSEISLAGRGLILASPCSLTARPEQHSQANVSRFHARFWQRLCPGVTCRYPLHAFRGLPYALILLETQIARFGHVRSWRLEWNRPGACHGVKHATCRHRHTRKCKEMDQSQWPAIPPRLFRRVQCRRAHILAGR